ncbi:MAG: amidohydrolase [Gemmatimonadales bacterium]
MFRYVIGGVIWCLAVGPLTGQERVTTLTNGRIWTGDVQHAWVEAIAVRGASIVAVGTTDEIRAAYADAADEDLAGGFVVPGFIDTHTHFGSAGRLLLGLNLLNVSDDAAFEAAVAQAGNRLPEGSWLVGGDWGAYDLGSDWVPSRALLDSLTGARPALIRKWDRSVWLANSAALRRAGLDPTNNSGFLEGADLAAVRAVIGSTPFEQRLAEARLAMRDLAAHGVTTIHDITSAQQLGVFQHLAQVDSLSVRVCARPTLDHWSELAGLGIRDGFGSEWIFFCGLKGFVDGIMGNSSAKFREPYDHTPESDGAWRAMMSPDGNMQALINGADSAGLSPNIHAIGDLAVDTLLDLFESAIATNGPRSRRRFRMIHAQVVEPDDFSRFGELGIIAEVQPYHAIDDMRWMEDRIGERSSGAYAFRSLIEGGAMVVFGSDWPGTNASWYPSEPLLGIYAAVTRKTLDGDPANGWYPSERITVEEALRAYTVNAAYAGFEEHRKGMLRPGFLADLVVLSQNLFDIPAAQIRNVMVQGTMVGGRWVYRRTRMTP